MNASQQRLIDVTLASLRESPDYWAVNEYIAKSRYGIRVWIANGRGGMDIDGFGLSVGGVVLFPLAPWRYKIYAAVDRIRCARADHQIRAIGESEDFAPATESFVIPRHGTGAKRAQGISAPFETKPDALEALAKADPKCEWSAERAMGFLKEQSLKSGLRSSWF